MDPQNTIIIENARTDGVTPQSYWDVEHTRQIEGFATEMSVNAGEQIDFKINVNGDAGSDYLVEIFRLGYYGGDGARKVAEWVNTDAVVQADAIYEEERALVDAGNWEVTDSWQTPEEAVSGVYLARLQRLDANGDPIEDAVNQIPFILREDDRPADIVLQTSDTTWHAYNGWFGNNGEIGANFYGDASGTVDHPDIPGAGDFAQDRAYAVSYNRPLITRGIEGEQGGPAAGAQDYLFGADYAAIFWLEKNGYDISYISGVDTDRLGPDYLTKYEAFISVGHDEYWSGDQRFNVEQARDAGVNLLFWGGNDVYWRTRWESSIVDGVEHRTLVSYKETWASGDPNAGPEDYPNLDPADEWTGTWRDMRFAENPLAGVSYGDTESLTGTEHICNCAENALIGTLFGPDATGEFGESLDIPEAYAPLRVWRDTSFADGGALEIAPGILGYEWNTAPDDENRPDGLIKLSETTRDWSRILVDQGNRTEAGTETHSLTMYRAESGAIVFSAGTVFWTWALSDNHDGEPYDADIENVDLQQFVVNMFADIGIQPNVADAILQSQGLVRAVASSDDTPATVAFDPMPDTVAALSTIVLSGTATDDDGDPGTEDGVVALVEISFDGGENWREVSGRGTWSYEWIPFEQGSYEVLLRAVDDSINIPTLAESESIEIEVTEPIPPESVQLFSFTEYSAAQFDNGAPLELGVRFAADVAGEITALSYYRDAADADDTDVRSGSLWDAAGNLLSTVQFVSSPDETGWQVATLDTPVTLSVGQTYTASYTTDGPYVAQVFFFGEGFSEPYGFLTAEGGANGVFGTPGALPGQSFQSTNYWVDVTFAPTQLNNAAPVFTSLAAVTMVENDLLANFLTADDPEGDTLRFTISGGADADLFHLDQATGTLVFAFAPDFEAPADADGDNVYEVTVTVRDDFNAAVEQDITVAVLDDESETDVGVSTLFASDDAPAQTITSDPTDYELGVQFTAQQAGEVTSLRYFRGVEDAGDTDVRTLTLWSANGTVLASSTVSSAPGASGWQIALLDTPVSIEADESFVVSYGTTQNYVASSGFFASDWSGPDGVLEVNGPASGVYSTGGPGTFPTAAFNSSNYWVDVSFKTTISPPAFTSPSNVDVFENNTFALLVDARGGNGDPFGYSIVGGADESLFEIGEVSGELRFISAPDFEAPEDANGNNVYEVEISATDGSSTPITQQISVTIADDPNEGDSGLATLFGPTDQPDTIITTDSTDYELGLVFAPTVDGRVEALRYWRGEADASDTDIRTLNLWAADGSSLGTVTVTSAPGQTGWQSGTLSAPIAVNGGTNYVVSYGTEQNYAVSSGFFASGAVGTDGILTAPVAAGVFSTGGPGTYPTQSYNNANYWVDALISPDVEAPVFLTPSNVAQMENRADILTLSVDLDTGTTPTYAILGGDDADEFVLNPSTGALSFVTAPDFEAPGDADADNLYELLLSVEDGFNDPVELELVVEVTNDPAEGAAVSTLFAQDDAPTSVDRFNTSSWELGVRFFSEQDVNATGLRYFRTAEDSADTDTRILTLWSQAGDILGSADVTSTSGETGWQVASLDAPITLDADETYIVSYGTAEAYAFTPSFFDEPQTGPDGILSAAPGQNGVYASQSGAFPTASFNDNNYWVDVIVEPVDVAPIA